MSVAPDSSVLFFHCHPRLAIEGPTPLVSVVFTSASRAASITVPSSNVLRTNPDIFAKTFGLLRLRVPIVSPLCDHISNLLIHCFRHYSVNLLCFCPIDSTALN